MKIGNFSIKKNPLTKIKTQLSLSLLSLIFCTITLQAADFKIPPYQGFVTDVTGTLTPLQIQQLNTASQTLQTQSTIQVATLIIPELGTSDTIESAAEKVFQAWKIGQKDQDNGVLFITALADRKTRIEVGYGLEGPLNDGKVGALLDTYVIPHFKQGDIPNGIINGHLAIIKTLQNSLNLPATTADNPVPALTSSTQPKPQSPFTEALQIGLLIGFFWLMIKSRTFRAFIFGLLLGRFFGGSGRNRSSGGGFGGFGGGSSGGGGSSRGW